MTTLDYEPKAGPFMARQMTEDQRIGRVDDGSLAKVVEGAVRAVDSKTLTPVAPLDAGFAFQPKALLALLALSYARQIYSSTDIESSSRGDSNFRLLCRGQYPNARILRRFRRANRKPLLTCLKIALRFLAEQYGSMALGDTFEKISTATGELIEILITVSEWFIKSQSEIAQPKGRDRG